MKNTGEELARTKAMVLTREDTRAETDVLFDQAKAVRQADRAKLERLFVQTPGAQTMAPNLQKESAAKNVEAFFEKKAFLTDAQRSYPELLKVASTRPAPNLKKKDVPVRASISGGAA